MTFKDLTIVITTYKSEDKIENCLNSIDSHIKVIVIENSNNQKFKVYIESKFSNVECILANNNLGYGKANNIGLKKVKTKYSLILNPDTVLEKETINNFFIFLQEKINFALLGPLQYKMKKELKIDEGKNLNLTEENSITGHAMFLNMSQFANVGFFDENFFLYYEEEDLCKRLKKLNKKIYVDKRIKIFHYGAKSVSQFFFKEVELNRNWHLMWSFFYYHKKHFNYFYALILILPKFFSSLINIFFYKLIFKDEKSKIYTKRLSGLLNSMLGNTSWHRPI